MAAKITLDTVERKVDLEQVRLQEIERSTAFVTGMIIALNEAFDTEVEKKTQEGFELGWKAHEKQLKSPDKPLPKKMGARVQRMG